MSHQPAKQSLKTIYFYLTAACNLRCCHCWFEPDFQGQADSPHPMDTSIFQSILNQGGKLGLEHVKFTGGEPLLNPLIDQYVEICISEGMAITIETNGTLCSNVFVEQLAKCHDVHVSVSLDGATADVHDRIRGTKGSFARAIHGIRNLTYANIRPQIVMTVMRHNVHQLEEVVELAVNLGADSVALNVVQPVARGKRLQQSGSSVSIDRLIAIGSYVENKLSEVTHIPLYFGHPPAFRPLSKLFEHETDSCGSCGIKNIISVLPDGSYAICGIGKSIAELRLGRADKDPLAEIWENSPTLIDIRNSLPDKLRGVCQQCLLKYLCLGKCAVQTYPRDSGVWKSFWYCQEAYDKGLFPVTRLLA